MHVSACICSTVKSVTGNKCTFLMSAHSYVIQKRHMIVLHVYMCERETSHCRSTSDFSHRASPFTDVLRVISKRG